MGKGSRPVTAAVLCLSVAIAGGTATGEPFVPADDSVVVAIVPAANDPAQAELAALRSRVSEAPGDRGAALALARRTIEIGRIEADPRYAGYAEAVLAPWLAVAEPDPEALVLAATLMQSRHRFAEALDMLAKVLARDPDDAQAWLTRAVIESVGGRYDAAIESCRRLIGLVDPLVVAACMASPASLSGRAAWAYQTLAAASEIPGSDAGLRQWALTDLAEIAARLGERDAAEAHFRSAIALGEPDAYLLGAYADFLLDDGRAAEVIALLSDETRVDGLLLRLALAEARLGKAAAERTEAVLADRFRANALRGDTSHLREQARFTLELEGDPARALDLAIENWATQKEPWDARLVLAAAIASGRTDRAAPVVDFLKETGLEDAQIEPLVAAIVALP